MGAVAGELLMAACRAPSGKGGALGVAVIFGAGTELGTAAAFGGGAMLATAVGSVPLAGVGGGIGVAGQKGLLAEPSLLMGPGSCMVVAVELGEPTGVEGNFGGVPGG